MTSNSMDSLLNEAELKSKKACDSLGFWQDIPPILYHFTNLPTLINILENKTIRFTNYKYLNDETELKFSLDGIKQYVKENNLSISDEYLSYLNSITSIINKRKNTYIFCLTKIIDNLAMWRMYANDSFGVAIGFNSDINPEKNNNNLFIPFIAKTVYGIKYPTEIKELLCFLEKMLQNEAINKELNQTSNIEKLLKFKNLIGTPLHMLSMINKHHSFELEEEIRLLLFDGELAYGISHPQGYSFPEKYRCTWHKEIKQSDLKIIQFHDQTSNISIRESTYSKTLEGIDLTDYVLKNLREIIIGSRHSDSMIEKINYLLNKNGFKSKDIKVEKYNSPYIG